MKKTLLLWLFGLLLTAQVFAQNRTLSGTVKDEKGEALIGVNVTGKGTTIGTVTDIEGKYTLELPKDVTALLFSYIGYKDIEKTILSLKVDAVMVAEGQVLEETVITAVAIKREKRSTSYATQTISGDALNQTGTNVLTALQGKAAGVKINSTSGTVGSSTRIVIRGENSLTGNNNALFVVDGIPINNTSRGIDDNYGSYADYGNRGNDINPDDIENLTVLSGASAIALYGSRGANGVILITTKSGKQKADDKNFKVSINTGMTFDKAYIVLGRQNQYGEGYYPIGIMPGENFSWGPKLDGIVRPWTAPTTTPNGISQLIRPYSAVNNQLESFFNTGITSTAGIAIEGGKDKFTFYLSYNNTNNKGTLPYSYYKKHNVTFNANAELSDKLTTGFSLQYSNVLMDPKLSGREFANGYMSAIQTPVNIPISESRDYNSVYHNLEGYWGTYTPNPYFILANTKNESKSHNILAKLELTYKPIKDLALTARVGSNIISQTIDVKEPKFNYTIDKFNLDNFGGNRVNGLGRYRLRNINSNDLNLDVIANYSKSFKKNFDFNLIGGFNFTENSYRNQFSTTSGGLIVPDFYDLSNSVQAATTNSRIEKRRLLGLYGNLNLGWKKLIYIDYSVRNDWSSTLPVGNNSYFYQGGGVSFIPTEFIKANSKVNDYISYVKIRASASTTGKDADVYKLYSTYVSNPSFDDYSSTEYQTQFPVNGIDGSSVGGYTLSNNIGNPKLAPELTFTWEVGTDINLFKERIKLMYTYYQKKSTNLIVNVSLPSSSGYTTQTQNIGSISNKGHELTAIVTPIMNMKGVNWELRGTFTKNTNKVLKVSDEIDELVIGGTTDASIYAVKGQPFGTFKVFDWATDSLGRYIVDANGKPSQATNRINYGNYQPNYQLSWGSTLSWKGLSLSVDFNMSKGGQFYSVSKELSDFNGTSLSSLANDRLPYVMPNSVTTTGVENTTAMIDPYPFFRDLPSKYNLIDASYIKLREASISYTLPSKVFKNVKALSGITLSLVGRNLKYWLPKENVFADPESNSLGLNGNEQGYEVGTTPSSRSYGFNVKIVF
jgi:TonB-linked SusC/RagA family outer membrane protein